MNDQYSGQVKLIEQIRAGYCRDVLKMMDKRTLKRITPSYKSKMIIELIPRNTRPAKELAELLLKYGKIDWGEKDHEGRLIHAVMIRYGRVEMASQAVDKTGKNEICRPELSSVWYSLLWWFLDKHQRMTALAMIQKGALLYMPEDELAKIARKIISCHDISLLEAAGKNIGTIPAEALQMPETLTERQFMQEMLNRFKKHIDFSKDTEKLMKK